MSYSLGLESKGRKNRLEILDFQTLSYKSWNHFRSIFSDQTPLGWRHPEHEEKSGSQAGLTKSSKKARRARDRVELEWPFPLYTLY